MVKQIRDRNLIHSFIMLHPSVAWRIHMDSSVSIDFSTETSWRQAMTGPIAAVSWRRPEHKALLDLKLRLHLPHHDPLPQWSHDPIFP